jgi:hypothetical protein
MRTSEQIANDNDAFRQRGQGDGRRVCTRGVSELGPVVVLMLARACAEQTVFSEDDDPHGEHDFGSAEAAGVRVFWKIDYYDNASLDYGADPRGGDVYRVLTIMLREEY